MLILTVLILSENLKCQFHTSDLIFSDDQSGSTLFLREINHVTLRVNDLVILSNTAHSRTLEISSFGDFSVKFFLVYQ